MGRLQAWVLTGTLLVWGLVALAPRAAAAQEVDPASTALLHVGPLALTPGLSIPSAGLESNVFNESDDPRDDFVADIQPQLDAWLRFGRLRLDGKQQFNYLYFNRYSAERALNTTSTVNGRLDLLWARPHASIGFVRAKERPDARIDTRAVHRSHPMSAGIDFPLSSTTSIDLTASINDTKFDNGATFGGTSLQTALDRKTRRYQGLLRYNVTPPTTLTVNVARQEDRFRFTPAQNSSSLRVVPGVVFAADSVISGDLQVGWMSFEPESAALRPFTGVVASGSLGYVLLGLTRFQVSVNRDVTPSIDRDATYALQTGVTGTITHRVSERWDVNASASHLRMDFGEIAPLLPSDVAVDRVDTINSYGGGIGFYFTRGLRIGIRAESIQRDSVVSANRYDNLRILSSISYTRQ